jgi:hypothetical protein
MLPSTARYYNPDGPQRVAVVSAEPVPGAGEFVIHLARGASASKLKRETTYGPFPAVELAGHFAEVAVALRGEGFFPAGLQDLLEQLEDADPTKRGLAALRLGWRRSADAVDPLLTLLPNAVDEICAIVDALGLIGDPQAIPHVRPVAQRKLLSRRRSGVEALRNLGDAEGLTTVRQFALERLPELVRGLADAEPGNPDQLAEAVLKLDIKDQGPALDTLYELAAPATVAAVRLVLAKVNFAQAHLWRATKSIFKRSLLRRDYVMMGWLNHAIEARGRKTPGTSATVKSGYDGAQRHTRIFQRWTQQFMRRLIWRYLRDTARYRPDEYAAAAAEVVIHYGPEDGDEHAYWGPRYGGCFALHQILFGASKRFAQSGRKPTFRYPHGIFKPKVHKAPPPEVHEEKYPELWEAQPRAFLRILSAARLPEAHVFAMRAVTTTHPDLIAAATAAELVGMLSAPYEPTVKLGLAELERRFDPHNPDEEILNQLLRDERPFVRDLGQKWLTQALPFWIGDAEKILRLLDLPHPISRDLVAGLVVAQLGTDPALRETLAKRILSVLRMPESPPGIHEGYARVAREVLAEQMTKLVTVAALMALLDKGSPSAKSLAAHLLGRHTGALQELGLEKFAALAEHELVAVRHSAHVLIRAAVEQLRADPSLLFVLVESEWDDTRATALDLLRNQIDPAMLGFDGLMGLLDSNRVDVQNVGIELTRQHFHALPGEELVNRLTQHPHPNMRRFALELVQHHLPAGDKPLTALKGFCRSALFDLTPELRVKRDMLTFLTRRGLQDPEQAAVVAAILGDVVRVQTRGDFERSLEALVRIKLAYPEIETTVALPAGGAS